jgi:hypothetical protein
VQWFKQYQEIHIPQTIKYPHEHQNSFKNGTNILSDQTKHPYETHLTILNRFISKQSDIHKPLGQSQMGTGMKSMFHNQCFFVMNTKVWSISTFIYGDTLY